MRQKTILVILIFFVGMIGFSFKNTTNSEVYELAYHSKINGLNDSLQQLLTLAGKANLESESEIKVLQSAILNARIKLKNADFWLRYLEPIAYKKINGPLPVEWETEVFEKFEKPYKREGAGLTLAALYLEEDNISNDSLSALIQLSVDALKIFSEDSITKELKTFSSFYFSNRLHLLNLASIYSTGFECPDTDAILPELIAMMQ